MNLVRALRYRRHLGRVGLERGLPPEKPEIAFVWPLHWFLTLLLAGVLFFAVMLSAVAIIYVAYELVYLAIAVGLLTMLPRFRRWLFPVLNGAPCRSLALVQSTSAAEVFAYGAVPVAALALSNSHDAVSISIMAAIGGLVLGRPP